MARKGARIPLTSSSLISKPSQDLSLSGHLLHPLLLGELLAEAVRDGVGGDLVAVRVERLNQGVVSPLVTHVEGGGDGTTVGVLAAGVKDVLVETLVEVVH